MAKNEKCYYCPRCGRIAIRKIYDEVPDRCKWCDGATYKELVDWYDITGDEIWSKISEPDQIKIYKYIWNTYVKKDPEFNEKIFNDSSDRLINQIELAYEAKLKYPLPKAIHCPTCNSTNIDKISGLERGASVLTLGLFSKKINKSFKCKNCGYTW